MLQATVLLYDKRIHHKFDECQIDIVSDKDILIGVSVGLVVLLLIIGLSIIFFCKKKKLSRRESLAAVWAPDNPDEVFFECRP